MKVGHCLYQNRGQTNPVSPVELPGLSINEFTTDPKTENASPRAHPSPHDWRPVILQRWAGVGLIMLLLALIICIGVLFAFSRGPGLYESAFVYQLNVSIFKSPVATLAPYSIVPTLVAVTVSLWWGSLEATFRRLQPFVTMTKEPTAISCGATLSYASSYLLWAVAKAISKRHWVLALVCMGAFFTQICKVSCQFTDGVEALIQTNSHYRNVSIMAKGPE